MNKTLKCHSLNLLLFLETMEYLPVLLVSIIMI